MDKRRILPRFPIHLIVDDPDAIAMTAAPFGMFCRLCFYYWQSDLKPLPRHKADLAAIMRAHISTFAAHGDLILTVFERVRPAIDKARADYDRKISTIKLIGARGNATRSAQASAARVAASLPVASPPLPVAPRKARTPVASPPLPVQSPDTWRD